MALTVSLARFLPSAETKGNLIRTTWDRCRSIPGASRLFSYLVGQAAPYTGTIGARVEALQLGYSRVSLRDRRAVRNHLRSVHAIALANLAEFTGNLAVAYGLPDDARFIVKGMSIDYLKKARGTITAECMCPAIEGSARREYAVQVELKDKAGDVVAKATLGTLVGPKKH